VKGEVKDSKSIVGEVSVTDNWTKLVARVTIKDMSRISLLCDYRALAPEKGDYSRYVIYIYILERFRVLVGQVAVVTNKSLPKKVENLSYSLNWSLDSNRSEIPLYHVTLRWDVTDKGQ
jgi:hypothetical protein